MSDGGNIVQIAEAFKNAKPRKKKGEAAPPSPPGGGAPPRPSVPTRLPDECPVRALGTMEGKYYYLDALGQQRALTEDKHGRLHILSLFLGRTDYLNGTWPKWELDKSTGQWTQLADFNHSLLAPVLINSCADKGVWNPANKVRGPGGWLADDRAFVLHCGRYLWVSTAVSSGSVTVLREDAGVRDEMLYPRRPQLPEPMLDDLEQPGPRLLEMLSTWNWKRRDLDPRVVMGWFVTALIGQAAPWRPVLWVTGGRGTGKSTLRLLFEWVIGLDAMIAPTNTSQAYVYQTIGDRSLPVVLDEFEPKDGDNRKQSDVIELMRIAASGGELGRGGSENNPKTYTLRSCFGAFSILIPPLPQQDRSRMAICELRKLHESDEGAPEFDFDAPEDDDLVLGSKDKWARTGKQLRGRILKHWPRYLKTYKAYFQALMRHGFDHRQAQQFGALGAGFDLAMYEELTRAHIDEWLKLMPDRDPSDIGEPQGCLQHLLAATPDVVRHGTRETVAHYLRNARRDMENDNRTNDPDDATRVLAKIGIRVCRDAEMVSAGEGGKLTPVWWMCVSNTHPALAEIFRATHWKGKAGAPGTYVQALRGLEGADEKARELRIDGRKNWVTRILWDAVFPPFGAAEDGEEIGMVDSRDRSKTAGEVLS